MAARVGATWRREVMSIVIRSVTPRELDEAGDMRAGRESSRAGEAVSTWTDDDAARVV
jgi:hypothetical protein